MLNYIRAEWYKLLHRKYTLIFIAILLACEALLVSGWVYTNAHGNTIDFHSGVSMVSGFLSMGTYLLVIIGDIVFSAQYKNNTLKNEVSFGIPRARIYLGKYLTGLMLGVLVFLLLLVFYTALCWFTLLPSTAEKTIFGLSAMAWTSLAALPQFVGMLAVCFLLFFFIRGEQLAAFAYIGMVVVPQMVFGLMAVFSGHPIWGDLKRLMPVDLIDYARFYVGNWSYMASCWAMGAFWLVVSVILGLLAFRKKEIS